MSLLWREPTLSCGLLIVCVSLLLAVIGPWVVPYDPFSTGAGEPLEPPSFKYWMGTDRVGMDVFSRMIWAFRIDLFVSLIGVGVAMILGTTLGLVTGYHVNFFTDLVVRICDLVKSFPVLVLAMLTVMVTGHNVGNLVFVLGFLYTPTFQRLIHAQTLYVKNMAFIDAAKTAGNPERRILFRHILPNSLGPIFVQFSVSMGYGMLMIASLSFIGAGVKVPTPEWGSMIAMGAVSIMEGGHWWPSVFPGVALTVTVIGYSMVGDALHKLTDPTRR
jgi:peptide/nickel transport system permease protein